jgi:hypothetical protein
MGRAQGLDLIHRRRGLDQAIEPDGIRLIGARFEQDGLTLNRLESEFLL